MGGRTSRLGIAGIVVLLVLLAVGVALDAYVEGLARGGSGGGSGASTAPSGPTPAPTLPAAALAAAFAAPHDLTTSYGPLSLRRERIADLFLPTGAIAASDPFFPDALPFSDRLGAGNHPVSVLVARFASGDERVVAALVGEPDAVTWRPANVASGHGEGSAYGVDSGTGSFLSPEAGAAADGHYEAFSKELLEQLHARERSTWDWANVIADPSAGANVVAFASGFGDGAYESSFGFDAAGRPVALLTDFGILDRP